MFRTCQRVCFRYIRKAFSQNKVNIAQGPHSHILMMGGPSDFFGSEILAKSAFGSMKDARIFLGHEEKQRDFWVGKEIFWVC